jgi:hypothetical protein
MSKQLITFVSPPKQWSGGGRGKTPYMKNENLAHTQITDTIRVSTASIFYEAHFGNYLQVETFIFSKDERISTQQIIHGTCSAEYPNTKLFDKAKKAHNYISENLKNKIYENHDNETTN